MSFRQIDIDLHCGPVWAWGSSHLLSGPRVRGLKSKLFCPSQRWGSTDEPNPSPKSWDSIQDRAKYALGYQGKCCIDPNTTYAVDYAEQFLPMHIFFEFAVVPWVMFLRTNVIVSRQTIVVYVC